MLVIVATVCWVFSCGGGSGPLIGWTGPLVRGCRGCWYLRKSFFSKFNSVLLYGLIDVLRIYVEIEEVEFVGFAGLCLLLCFRRNHLQDV
jgi:hypothetical protein